MQRFFSHILPFCLLLLAAPSLQAKLSWNPLEWFESGEKSAEKLDAAAVRAAEADAAALIAKGKAKLEAGNSGGASRIFKKAIKRYGKTKAVSEARYLRGRIFMTRGKWKKAFHTLQDIVAYHPDFEGYNAVTGAQFDCATALMEGARGRILWIIPGFRQYDEAIRQFDTIVRNGPYSDYAPLALMNIALIAKKQNEPDTAIDALDRLINYYPQSMLAPNAYRNMAATYASLVQGADYDQGATRRAISYYEDFLILFPQSSYLGEIEANLDAMRNLLAQSRLNLGDFFYFYRNNNTAALVFYNEAITVEPDSQAAEVARARISDVEAGVRPVSGAQFVRKLLFID